MITTRSLFWGFCVFVDVSKASLKLEHKRFSYAVVKKNYKKWIKTYFVDFYFITVFSIYSSRLVAIFPPFIGFVCIKEETSGETTISSVSNLNLNRSN